MTIPTAPPSPPDHASSGAGSEQRTAPHRAERFLLWVAGSGIVRTEGWLGGVAAGIATRLRIDPLLVRGVLVVAALFGLPVIFVYAVAWALLPDGNGRVHLRELLHRDHQPVQLGILGMAIVGLFPTAPLTGQLFGFGYASWGALAAFGWIVGVLLVGALVFLIVRAARRTPGASAPDLPMASADQAAPGASDSLGGSGTAEGADAISVDPPAAAEPVDTAPLPPAPLAAGAQDPAEIAAWRAQHAAWKEQDQAWRRRQQDAERAVRDHMRRERQASAAAFALEAAERRRISRASNPRAGFASVSAVMGLAIISGVAVGSTVGAKDPGVALGLLAAALVLAIGMMIIGSARRRSGFLAFLTAATLGCGLVGGAASTIEGITFGWASISNDAPAHVRQPFGDLSVTLYPHDGAPRPIVIEKGDGRTDIFVDQGVRLDLRATVDTATVRWTRMEVETGAVLDSGRWEPDGRSGTETFSERLGAERVPQATVQTVTVDQRSGDISVTVIEAEEDER